jgi:plastocyanin
VSISENRSDQHRSWGFQPAHVTIRAGTTVAWRNNGEHLHGVTSEDGHLDSGQIAPGQSYRYRFDVPGSYEYHCVWHPWMTGRVRVTELRPDGNLGEPVVHPPRMDFGPR